MVLGAIVRAIASSRLWLMANISSFEFDTLLKSSALP